MLPELFTIGVNGKTSGGWTLLLPNVHPSIPYRCDKFCSLIFPGAPALTTRGFTEEDFERSVSFFDDAVNITKEAKANSG